MLNTNNTVNYETNIKQKEKKYSWSTVFSWLYLKTIGRILPKKWNKWAENILYYNKATGSDEIRTDKTTDESAQIDLKPEVTVKESQSEIVSEDEKVQTNKDEATFQDTTMQTECVETTDKNIGADLKPEVAEKGSQSEVISKNETTFQDTTMQTECVETTDKNIGADLESEKEKALEDKNEELKEQLEDVSQALKAFIRLCDDQAQQIADLQLGDDFLEEENKELRSKLAELERNYRELAEVAKKRGEEFLAKLEEKSKEILKLNKELIERSTEFANKTEKLSVDAEEKDTKISNLMRLNEGLDEDKKKMEAEVENLKKQLQSAQESKQQLEEGKIDLEGKLKDLSSQLSTVVSEKKDLENKVARLQEQVRTLEESKEWELAGIDDSLKKVFLDVIGMLEKELLINNQEQQLQGKKVDLIEGLKAELKKESDEALQEAREKIAEQEKLIEQLQKEQQQAEKTDIKKLQKEKENMEEQLKILTQQLLNNQEQQNLEKELKNVDKRLEDIDEKTKEQTEAKAPDTVSTAKSTTGSMKSTQSNVSKVFSKLFGNQNLNNFLSRKNEELKKGFPEFKEKHFCHNVLDETIKSLLNQNHGKFESSKLLELLESNLKKSAREILKDKVKKLDPGKNKEIFIEESAETRMKLFSDKIQELQLVSSIRDKFLSLDQKMCSRIPGKENKYQLTEKAKKEYTPNSLMSHTNTVSVRLLNAQRVA
ncbi:coiled-coil domain-containing protein [Wolbachia endosymbiont of Oedothorax gibbosus]|uniref:hypothetical protein n=1 Tax=Wolbachia endosymbiont of Oedothorax gibbosus TaxID=931100 RepID=UPI0020247A81|nr:hypothetical protein [Wolbachia endosymbiont of Oedothorax gibbosus]